MAISQICKFEVKEELDHYVKEQGLSHREAAKQLAKQLTELMGEEVSSEALRQKAIRAETGSKQTSDPTPSNHTESEGNQTNQTSKKKAKDGTDRGGKREGAGRKLKHQQTYEVSDAMQFAIMAIADLERIQKDDPKKEEALNRVIKWIEEQLNQGG